jgi:hypothetical protein
MQQGEEISRLHIHAGRLDDCGPDPKGGIARRRPPPWKRSLALAQTNLGLGTSARKRAKRGISRLNPRFHATYTRDIQSLEISSSDCRTGHLYVTLRLGRCQEKNHLIVGFFEELWCPMSTAQMAAGEERGASLPFPPEVDPPMAVRLRLPTMSLSNGRSIEGEEPPLPPSAR